MSTVKISNVCGVMQCGLVAANMIFRFIYSDNKAENLYKMSILFYNITRRHIIHRPRCGALRNEVTCLLYFVMVLKRHPHSLRLCRDELQGDLQAAI